MTYRAHCLGVRLRRALKKRPRYPLINGERFSYSEVVIRIDGVEFKALDSINFTYENR